MPPTGPKRRNRRAKTAIQRLCAKISIQPNGCWEWTGAKAGVGYGAIAYDGRLTYTHRVAYELFVGPIGSGLQIDHLCRNRICCNPDHLEPVTQRENMVRGTSLFAQQLKRTHCPRGHEYTAENTHLSKRNERTCRQCGRDKARAKRGWDGGEFIDRRFSQSA